MWNIFDITFLLYEVGRLHNVKYDFQTLTKSVTDPVDIAVCKKILYI